MIDDFDIRATAPDDAAGILAASARVASAATYVLTDDLGRGSGAEFARAALGLGPPYRSGGDRRASA